MPELRRFNVRRSFKDAGLGVRIFAVLGTAIVVLITSPFWLVLIIVNFVESPITAWHLLTDRENWKPFDRRDEK
jgi:hypothetical protein